MTVITHTQNAHRTSRACKISVKTLKGRKKEKEKKRKFGFAFYCLSKFLVQYRTRK